MGFGLNLNAGGNYLPILKYDARAGRLSRIDRDETTGEQEPVDITDIFEAAVDFEHGEEGWRCSRPVRRLTLKWCRSASRCRRSRRRTISKACACASCCRRRRPAARSACAKWRRRPRPRSRGSRRFTTPGKPGATANPGKVMVVRLASVKPVPSGGGGQKIDEL